jgi:hypothetical protein
MLTSEQDLVQITGKRDLVIEEVVQPGATLPVCIRQDWQHVSQGNRHPLRRRCMVLICRSRPVVNSKSAIGHLLTFPDGKLHDPS